MRKARKESCFQNQLVFRQRWTSLKLDQANRFLSERKLAMEKEA